MDKTARLNQVSEILQKNELKQECNKLIFLFSLGITIHVLSCLNNPKKLNTADYIAVPTLALSSKTAYSLRKKEDKGIRLWNKIQQQRT